DDIDDQGSWNNTVANGNYHYDEIGNLKQDISEELDDIIWDHYGKIQKIQRVSGSTRPNLSFVYDASGNRISKTVVVPGAPLPETQYYVRDPQGNVIAIYRRSMDGNSTVFDLEELHIYGSERLGLMRDYLRLYDSKTAGNLPADGKRVINSDGERALIISGVQTTSPTYQGAEGKVVLLENVSDRRIALDGLSLEDQESAQAVQLPSSTELDPGERLAITYGDPARQNAVMAALGLDTPATDTALHWHFQVDFDLNTSAGTLTLQYIDADGEGQPLDAFAYGNAGLSAQNGAARTRYVATDPRFDAGEYSLGSPFGGSPLREPEPGQGGFGKFDVYALERGEKLYEFKDHLGNVTAVVGDRALPVEDGTNPSMVEHFVANVAAARDYYPFGSMMTGRNWKSADYRYGFNGQEKDDEINGEGNAVSFMYRVHDARLGRFLSVDPLAGDYPWNSTYAFAENMVLEAKDLEGAEASMEVAIKSQENAMIRMKNDHSLANGARWIAVEERYNELLKSDKLTDDQRSELSYSYDEAEDWYYTFYRAGLFRPQRALSAYALLRYAEGRGGVTIFPFQMLYEGQVHRSTLNINEPKIEKLASEMSTGTQDVKVTTDEVIGRKHGLTSDMGSALGHWQIDAVTRMRLSKDQDGNVTGEGTMYFTVVDKYDWDPERGWGKSLDGDWANHNQLYKLQNYGAKVWYPRAYYQMDVKFQNGEFEYSAPRESYEIDKHHEFNGANRLPSN
ncbi:MAG: RHS repeat-associated core domain-containing protein, partial [Bacteroidota bacterium]